MPVPKSPDSQLWRSGIDAVEAVGSLPETINSGLNFSGYDVGMFYVYPTGGAQPTIEIMVWNSETSKWISTVPAATFTGPAVDTEFTFTVPAYGRGLYARVSAIGAGSVSISAAGHTSGSW
jgi:hypothetical protein